MRIGFTGDMIFGEQPTLIGMGVSSMHRGRFTEVVAGFKQYLAENPVEALVVNFEGVLMPDKSYRKLKPMQAPAGAAAALIEIGATAASLANNHSMEYGPEIYQRTRAYLEGNGIKTFGHADDPGIVLSVGDKKMAVIAFSTVPAMYGFKPEYLFVDPGNSGHMKSLCDHFRRYRSECDFLVAYPHWGTEFMTEPSSEQVEIVEALKGCHVDLIVGVHPNIVQGAFYMDSLPVFFSLGNMVTDYPIEELRRNLFLEIEWDGVGKPDLKGVYFSSDARMRVGKIEEEMRPVPWTGLAMTEEEYREESIARRRGVRNLTLRHVLLSPLRAFTNRRLLSWMIRRGFFLFKNRSLLRGNPGKIYTGPIH